MIGSIILIDHATVSAQESLPTDAVARPSAAAVAPRVRPEIIAEVFGESAVSIPGAAYISFEKNFLSEFEESWVGPQQEKIRQSAQSFLRAKKLESPWSIEVEGYLPVARTNSQVATFGTQGDVRFKNRNGLEASLLNTFYAYDNSVPTSNRLYNVQQFEIGYDFGRGGKHSVAVIDTEIQSYDKRLQIFDVENNFWQARRALLEALPSVFASHCKLQDLNRAKESIEEVVTASRASSEAKATSFKDHLLVIDTKHWILRRIQDEIFNLRQLEGRIAFFGNSRKLLGSRNEKKFICPLPSVTKINYTTEAIEMAAKNTPVLLQLNLIKDREGKALLRLKENRRASVLPYGAIVHSQRNEYDGSEARVGLRVTYDFDGGDKALEIRSQNEQIGYIAQKYKLLLNAEVQNLRALVETVNESLTRIPELEESIKNSQTLIEALKTQQKLGLIDGAALGSAEVNYIGTLLQKHDLWATLTSALSKTKQYQDKVASIEAL